MLISHDIHIAKYNKYLKKKKKRGSYVDLYSLRNENLASNPPLGSRLLKY